MWHCLGLLFDIALHKSPHISFARILQHVGMHINLHANPAQSLDISYDRKSGLLSEVASIMKGCMGGISKKSRISEYRHRMHSSREYWIKRSKGSATSRRGKRIRGLPSLDELYTIDGRFNEEMVVTKKGSSIYVYILISFFVSLEIALLLRMGGKLFGG